MSTCPLTGGQGSNPHEHMTIKKAIRAFLEHYECSGKPSARSYGPCLEKFERLCGHKRMSQIRLPMTTDRVAGILLESDLDQNTVWYVMTVVKIFLRFWNDQNVTKLPLRLLSVPKRLRKRQRAVKEDEHERMVASVDTTSFEGIRDVAVLLLLFETGMRVSELARLRIADIDFGADMARVRTSKTHAEDIVCWSRSTTELLVDLYMPIRENLKCSGEFLLVGRKTRNAWFRDGISTRSIQRIVRRYSKKCGYEGITPHKYRHGKAYSIHERGGTLADIRNILRHSSLDSSLSYLNMFEREDAQRMRKFLNDY